MASTDAPTPVQAPVCSIVKEAPAPATAESKPVDSPACSIVKETPAPATGSTPKKKICCACPDTKRLRDECIVEYGESACTKWIEAHKICLRAEGFKV
ncbi:cytochrome c oxidase copper chaperone 2-like [Lolium rigidum]|uniref:cytochrome c oxidase copper chaperone 2-like n=1 Tax=Lolium rigidum TaxID=89674 RepID=UPI001F5C352E|nr:cytochrome c oxidase copper chaperone 2-like [Lolium rigidum]